MSQSQKSKKRVTFAVSNEDVKKQREITKEELAYKQLALGSRSMFLYDYGLPIEDVPDMLSIFFIQNSSKKKHEIKSRNCIIQNYFFHPTNRLKYKIGIKMKDEFSDIQHLIDNETNEKHSNDILEPPTKKRRLNSSDPQNISNNIEDINIEIEPTQIILPNDKLSSNLNENSLSNLVENTVNNISLRKKTNLQEYQNKNDSLYKNGKNEGEVQLYNKSFNNTRGVLGKNGQLIYLKKKRDLIKPEFHKPWKLYKLISGHMGMVTCIAFDESNEWFVTGGTDRVLKFWDFPSGKLKLSLTGHIAAVRKIVISPRHPYMFTCGEDKTVKCWDLEVNKQIRQYHGHLSGVYDMAMHPTIDIIFSVGRDACCRVWDIRTKAQIMCLTGHKHTIHCIEVQPHKPQVITGSQDTTVRAWDLAKGKTITTLTHHKKSIRALKIHPKEYTYASGAADNIKVWRCPESSFLRDMNETPNSIVETLDINHQNVMVSGHQTGHLKFWDWKTGYKFQEIRAPPQSGSLDSEAGIYAAKFDKTGSRLITCEMDKSIKFWKEDSNATEETHPIHYTPKKISHY